LGSEDCCSIPLALFYLFFSIEYGFILLVPCGHRVQRARIAARGSDSIAAGAGSGRGLRGEHDESDISCDWEGEYVGVLSVCVVLASHGGNESEAMTCQPIASITAISNQIHRLSTVPRHDATGDPSAT
jgi:hypothetical protein